jgi:hypothetical protein
MNKAIEMSKEKIAEELKRFAKKEVLTPEEVKCYGEFIDMAKDISTIEGMGSYYGTPTMSNTRGRSPITGRFVSRDGNIGHNSPVQSSYDRGYDDGYSDARADMTRTSYDDMRSGHSIKDRMIASLEQMYANATTDHERQVVDKWIAKMRSDNT